MCVCVCMCVNVCARWRRVCGLEHKITHMPEGPSGCFYSYLIISSPQPAVPVCVTEEEGRRRPGEATETYTHTHTLMLYYKEEEDSSSNNKNH